MTYSNSLEKIQFLERSNAPKLAYIHYKGQSTLPTIMFLGGFCSDMQGTKAQFLQESCRKKSQSFIRFDYSGHGASEGIFEERCITDWKNDALAILDLLEDKPVVLIGSSMGGWISLLIALEKPKHVQALIGLAAAPDFTSWMESSMNEKQINQMKSKAYFELPNDYDDKPYIISKHLIEDGRNNLLLDKINDIKIPVRLIQGKKDNDVPWQTAEKIRDSIINKNVEIIYIEDADHRLSSPDQLKILNQVLESLI